MATKLPPKENPHWLGTGAVLAAIGASACCVGPLLLISLGIGGAWMSALTSMGTVRPIFIELSLIFIGLGYRKLYLLPENCKEGNTSATAPSCALPEVKHNQRLIFWIGSTLSLLLLTFPWVAPLFME